MDGFKDVVGHREIIRYIQDVVSTGKVSHAYILNGAKGSGKKMLANLFAMSLVCESERDAPCGKCHSCIQAKGGNHPDIVTVRHEKPSAVSVDEVREQLNADIQIRPFQSKYKIYIIPEADLMTAEAQNAILKTIEEPPAYAVIFLLAENAESLLPTIRSRCVILKLRNIKDALVRKYLMEQLHLPDYQADLCAAFAQGNIGRAVTLAESGHFREIRDHAVSLMSRVDKMRAYELADAVKEISAYKIDIADYLDIIAVWYRDVLIYKATREVGRTVFKDRIDDIRKKAQTSSYEGLEKIIAAIDTAKRRLDANVNFELTMELLLLTMKEN